MSKNLTVGSDIQKLKDVWWLYLNGYATLQLGACSIVITESGTSVSEHNYPSQYIIKIGSRKGVGKAITSEKQAYFIYLSEYAYSLLRPELEKDWPKMTSLHERYPKITFADFDKYAKQFYDYYNRGISVNRAKEPWYEENDDELEDDVKAIQNERKRIRGKYEE